MSNEDKKARDLYIQTIENLYPPDSQYQDTAQLGEEFMLWALKRFLSKFKRNWRELDEEILKDMAYYCLRHEEMVGKKED